MSDSPVASAELLEYLEKLYPTRCKRQGESEEAHQRFAGKVELILHMRIDAEANHNRVEEDQHVFQSEAS